MDAIERVFPQHGLQSLQETSCRLLLQIFPDLELLNDALGRGDVVPLSEIHWLIERKALRHGVEVANLHHRTNFRDRVVGGNGDISSRSGPVDKANPYAPCIVDGGHKNRCGFNELVFELCTTRGWSASGVGRVLVFEDDAFR